MKSRKLAAFAIALVVGLALLSMVVRPKEPRLEMVTPQQELPSFEAPYPGDRSLADRVLKSYELAFILVRNPYLNTNLSALEAMRQWARVEFQAHPDFLHPVSLPAVDDHRDTVFGALGYNVLAIPKFWLEEQIGHLLSLQISRFHDTNAYATFNNCFFGIYGEDADAAILLARYQSDRAKEAIDVILWTAIWLSLSTAGAYQLWQNRRRDVFDVIRRQSATAWLVLALAYLTQSWSTGHAAALVSTLVAGALSLYLYMPFMFVSHHEAKQQLVRIRLAPCWIAAAAWFTFSCIVVQLMTWMRTGILADPDPVSLFLCSLTGDFVHDPVQGKRLITVFIAASWLIITTWALLQRNKDVPYSPEPDANFDTLDEATTLDRLRRLEQGSVK